MKPRIPGTWLLANLFWDVGSTRYAKSKLSDVSNSLNGRSGMEGEEASERGGVNPVRETFLVVERPNLEAGREAS